MFKFILFLAFFVSFFVKSQVLFQTADNMLSIDKYLELQSDPMVVPDRYHLSRIDQNEIFRSINNNTPLVVNLFDVELRAHIKSTKSLAGGSTFISGSLMNGGHFTLFLHSSGVIRGEFHSFQGVYTLKSEGADFSQVLIKQNDLSKLHPCGNNNIRSNTYTDTYSSNGIHSSTGFENNITSGNSVLSSKVEADGSQNTAEDNNTVDVLVVYTQRAENYVGGPKQIQAIIENQVAYMNQVLENSGLPHR